MRVLITGARGFIGKALAASLKADGHEAVPLSHGKDWDVEQKKLDPKSLEGVDAVVHLAGESIFGLRWTQAKKRRIYNSRIDGTLLLSEHLAAMREPPKVLISGSAIGFYGDRGDEELGEKSPRGEGFLSDVVSDWEAASSKAAEAGIRVVNLRTGLVLDPSGGMLGKMLLPFKLCLGGRLGPGTQWMSWVSLADIVSMIRFAMSNNELEGPLNACSPNPVTNAEFTKTLGKVLGRPTPFPVPAFALKALLGQMGEELMLSSTRAIPQALQSAKYSFEHSDLQTALGKMLKQS